MQTLIPSPLLRRALYADAAGSAALAALQMAATEPLAGLTRLPAALIGDSGLVMAAYAAALLVLATRTRVPRRLVQAVIAGNALWALAATGIAWALALAAAGVALLAVHALWTVLFAALQRQGLARSAPLAGHNAAADPATLHLR